MITWIHEHPWRRNFMSDNPLRNFHERCHAQCWKMTIDILKYVKYTLNTFGHSSTLYIKGLNKNSNHVKTNQFNTHWRTWQLLKTSFSKHHLSILISSNFKLRRCMNTRYYCSCHCWSGKTIWIYQTLRLLQA